MAHKRSLESLLPKQVKVKRTSVSCNSSVQWIESFSDLTAPVRQNRAFSRISSVLPRTVSLGPKPNVGLIPDVSPISSPEDEFLTYSGHELLTIESADGVCKRLNSTDDHISDSCSLPSSQHLTQQGDCASTTAPSTVERTEPLTVECQRNSDRDTTSIDYLNELQRDTSDIPFVLLVERNVREKQSKNRKGIADRLHTLHRRLNSERSIWLHQRAIGREGVDRKTQLFRINSVGTDQSVGFAGLIAFKATIIDTPAEFEDGMIPASADKLEAIVLLPVSGTPDPSHQRVRSSSVGDLQSVILGDTVKIGDILRAFSPWSSIPSPGGSHPSLFHSFFWIERVRCSDLLPSWHLPDSCDSPIPQEPVQIGCHCLACGSKQNILSCSKRFRDPIDIFEETTVQILPPNLDNNSVLVLHRFKFWLLQKVRLAHLVQFYSGDVGLLLLPDQSASDENLALPKQTTGFAQHWMEPHAGGIYSVHGLLQLPLDHLSTNFLDSTKRYLTLFERQLSAQSVRKFSAFRSGSRSSSPLLAKTHVAQIEVSLWDARVARFRLIEANWIEWRPYSVYQNFMPACSRCQITGLLLFEIPDGSFLRPEERDRLSWSIKRSTAYSGAILDGVRKATHLFYLYLQQADMHTVIPCVCLPGVLSPCHLQQMNSPSIMTDNTPSRTHWFRSSLRIEQALVGQNFLILDWFTTMELDQAVPRARRSNTDAISSVRRPIHLHSIDLNSMSCLKSLRRYDLVRFSGVIACVDTTRSHTWPVCTRCFSSNLKTDSGGCGTSVLLQCQRCHTPMSQPKQLFEVEVTVVLDTSQHRGLPDPFCERGPQVILNISPSRIFRLLGLSARELAEATRINPKTMLYQRVDNVVGLVLRCQTEASAGTSSTGSHALVVELEECDSC